VVTFASDSRNNAEPKYPTPALAENNDAISEATRAEIEK
jgi:hypothetical protein